MLELTIYDLQITYSFLTLSPLDLFFLRSLFPLFSFFFFLSTPPSQHVFSMVFDFSFFSQLFDLMFQKQSASKFSLASMLKGLFPHSWEDINPEINFSQTLHSARIYQLPLTNGLCWYRSFASGYSLKYRVSFPLPALSHNFVRMEMQMSL